MRIAIDRLDPETLRRVVEEYVSRDGSELTDVPVKVQQVLSLLKADLAELHYDEESQTTTIVMRPGP